MKISIIIPIYNVSDYVEECIRSVMNQTYQGAMECILVDDCGTDDSMDKCESLIRSYKGHICFSVIRHSCNRGLSAARNTGIEAATGDYVFFIDSDDYIYPDCISLLAAEVRKHPEVELVQGAIDGDYCPWYSFEWLKGVTYVDTEYWMRKAFFKMSPCFPVTAWNKLLKKSFLLEHALFFKEGLFYEDNLWMYYLALRVRKIVIVHELCYFHRINGNSITQSTCIGKDKARHYKIILSECLANLENPYSERALLKYLSIYLSIYIKKDDFGKEDYDELVADFIFQLKRHRFYAISILLSCYHSTYDLLKGRGFRRIIYLLSRFYLRKWEGIFSMDCM